MNVLFVLHNVYLIFCSILVDNHEAEKQCRESDRSSNISDMKLELRTGSSVSRPGSETGSERGLGGVPLAGPVHLPVALNGGDHVYRYSTEYPEPSFPPKALNKVGATLHYFL